MLNPNDLKQLELIFRYLTRKIGFEAVMRVRCTRGITPHTFHGNFFVRSTDLLSLPNINPDVGFAMQASIIKTFLSFAVQNKLIFHKYKVYDSYYFTC